MRILIEGVEVRYDSVKALENVTLTIRSGELTFVIGPNGAGKTTLLKTIAGLISPSKGAVYIDGKALSSLSPKELGRLIALIDPHISRTIPSTVLEFLLTARYPHSPTMSFGIKSEDLEAIDRVSRQLNIAHLLNRRLDQVSSGELQRITIARAIIQEPRVLLLDEPSAFLDIRYRLEVLEHVKRVMKERDLVTLIAVHDLYLASLYADKVVVMDKGVIVAVGTPSEAMSRETLERVYRVKLCETIVNGRRILVPIEPLP